MSVNFAALQKFALVLTLSLGLSSVANMSFAQASQEMPIVLNHENCQLELYINRGWEPNQGIVCAIRTPELLSGLLLSANPAQYEVASDFINGGTVLRIVSKARPLNFRQYILAFNNQEFAVVVMKEGRAMDSGTTGLE